VRAGAKLAHVKALYHEVHGEPGARDLVLLHGWSLNLRVWDPLVRQLAPRYRIITVDLPGHGGSDWDPKASSPAAQAWRVHETLAPLTQRYCLLGWSLGGQVALDLAAALPAPIERLVLIATTPRFLAGPGWRCGTPRAQLARLIHRLYANSARAVNDFLALSARGSAPRTAAHVEQVLRRALKSDGWAHPAALASGLARLRDTDLRAGLARIDVPALVMCGQRDRIVRAVATRALARRLADAHYIEIRGAAHAPFLSHTRQCARHVREFLG
jgi:pimeloyl-[acyl-carrier protein] methyl ester esterase